LVFDPAGSQIIYSFIMMPHTLPANYVRFIRKQGAKELYVWQGVRVGVQCAGARRERVAWRRLTATGTCAAARAAGRAERHAHALPSPPLLLSFTGAG
jgi:hypothetical protein